MPITFCLRRFAGLNKGFAQYRFTGMRPSLAKCARAMAWNRYKRRLHSLNLAVHLRQGGYRYGIFVKSFCITATPFQAA